MTNCFFQDGLKFSCKQCSHCCRHEPGFVYLSKNDLTKLSTWFNLDIQEFCNRYCRWVDYYQDTKVLCLQEKQNFDCIFWDNGCKAYEARPIQCKTYPFWSFIIKDKQSWLEESKSCPGINNGQLHPIQEILFAEELYSGNVPLSYTDFIKMVGEHTK